VCDVACGTGETALKLAQKGHRVVGTDLAEDMIRVAKAKCGEQVTLLVQGMDHLSLPTPVDLLLCCYDSLNMVGSEAKLRDTFAAFFAALSPGGHVVCDLATTRHLAEDWGEQEIHAMVGDIDTVWHTQWDEVARQSTIHLTATVPHADGTNRDISVVTCRVQETGFAKATIDRAMGDAGFIIREVRDMIPWTPGDDDSQRLFYLLQRPPIT